MESLDLSGARGWLARARFAFQFARPRRTLLVLSHMRSYSSLLCHILNSNPEISGYVEQHRSYQSQLDLLDLRIRVAHTNQDRLRGRYVLDKVLHNGNDVGADILRREDVFTLFLVREPERTIKSILAMVGRKKTRKREGANWKGDPATYYVNRLDRLVEMARTPPARTAFLEADNLIESPGSVLPGLTSFLGLKHPLTPDYDTFEYTGKPRFGDPGKFISSGRIVRERREYGQIDVPEEDLLRAKESFEQARHALTDLCRVVL